MNKVLQQIRLDNKEFITLEELKNYCKDLYFNHKIIGNYLISRKYLVNIFDDIYYVKTNDEITKNILKFSILELLAKVLKRKHIKNWYYGLYTALGLINSDYENHDEISYLINDRILQYKPINILKRKFRFLRFEDDFFDFGIINGKIRYSDLEKTILDFIYLWENNHTNENRILNELSKLLDRISEEKILDYSQHYPKSSINILKKALNNFNQN